MSHKTGLQILKFFKIIFASTAHVKLMYRNSEPNMVSQSPFGSKSMLGNDKQ